MEVNELVKGGNGSTPNGTHDAGFFSLLRPIAVRGLTCTPRSILRNRPSQAGTRDGRLLCRPVRIGSAWSFCVVSGVSPIWLSVHLFQQVREDGKFKNLANKTASFLFFPSGNLCQYFGLREMHNVKVRGASRIAAKRPSGEAATRPQG